MKHKLVISVFLLSSIFFVHLVSAGDARDLSLSLTGTYKTSRSANAVFVDRDIAYIANSGDGLLILDVSTPSTPKKLGGYILEDAWNVVVANNIAYVIQKGVIEEGKQLNDKLVLIDVSDPSHPRKIGEYNYDNWNLGGIDVVGNIVYLTDTENLSTIDVSDPSHPIPVGNFNFGMSNLVPTDVTVVDDIAYITGGSLGLHILYVRNPSQPANIGKVDTTAVRIAVVGSVAYVTQWREGLEVIDISNPTKPIRIGKYDSPEDTLIDLYVVRNIAYVTYSRIMNFKDGGYLVLENGLIVLDISDSRNPREMGRISKTEELSDVFATANRVYVTEEGRGLHILEVTPVRPGINLKAAGIIFVMVSGMLVGLLLRRKKRGIYHYLKTIDNVFETYKTNLQKCEAELNKLNERIMGEFKTGAIKEDDFNIVKKKIDDYLANISRARSKDIRDIFPLHYTVLLIGPPGVGKFEYCINLIKHYLKNGENVVFITTERSPNRIKERLGSVGLDLEKYEGEKFIFIDVYSHSIKEKYEKGLNVDNPANLNLVNVNIEKALEMIGKPARIIFDSLSTLFLHASDAEIKRFFGALTSRVRTQHGFMVYTLQDGMHEAKTVMTLKHLVDSVVEMKFDEEIQVKRKFRIAYAREIVVPTDWFEYKIAEQGFEVVKE